MCLCVNNGKTKQRSESSCARAQHYSLLNEYKNTKVTNNSRIQLQLTPFDRTTVTQPLIPTNHYFFTNSHFHFSYNKSGFLQNYFSYFTNTSHTKKLQKEKHSEIHIHSTKQAPPTHPHHNRTSLSQ